MKPRRSRRVEPLKDSDYDHEINLLDHSSPVPRKPSTEAEGLRTSTSGPSVEAEPSPPERRSRTPEPATTAAAGHANGSPSAEGDDHTREHAVVPALEVEGPTPLDESVPQPTPSKRASKQPSRHRTPESAIDILYENQRGGFLCGIPLFASKALGNLDPPPWTNFAHKPSPTDITTAQPPDPSWEWAWPEWKVNHDESGDVDEEGWEYSFAFHRRFSWHGPRWWNSFVRRRAWIRKRVKKDSGYVQEDPSMLNAQYFSVRPASTASLGRSTSRGGSSRRGSKVSVTNSQNGDMAELQQPDIEDVESLLRAMRASRIDREKIEAIDNYLEHTADDFARLEREMHEIMSLFVFQASRRLLLTRMAHIHDQTTKLIEGGDGSEKLKQKAKNLTAAIKHADEEVRRLEYWSDIKEMVVEGETKGAMDHCEGWDERWQGLDTSGPAEPAAPGEGPE
ncbi:hypothetical protein GE09DRAFT_1010355 [Coniochaeta sp. 2T2.1]|nr:hypothetical protein GE09DRAFT_1010355 [Coniochaeta sp. 2T2.1]